MTSEGCAPAAAASVSRASSTVRRARRPALCREEGFPVRASSRVMTASASADMLVVAAWSRYTGTLQFYRAAVMRAQQWPGPGSGTTESAGSPDDSAAPLSNAPFMAHTTSAWSRDSR